MKKHEKFAMSSETCVECESVKDGQQSTYRFSILDMYWHLVSS